MKSPLVWVLICLNVLLCLFIFLKADKPTVVETKTAEDAAEVAKRAEFKVYWDKRVIDEMTYVRDPRNGECYRRVAAAHTLTYHPVSCISVESILVN
jgi:hypothetical protein